MVRRRVGLLMGGTLEHAHQIAAHESPRTTTLDDRTNDQITIDEIQRIAIRTAAQRDRTPGSFTRALSRRTARRAGAAGPRGTLIPSSTGDA